MRFGDFPSCPVVVDGIVVWTDRYTGVPSEVAPIKASIIVVAAGPETGSIRWSKQLSDEIAEARSWYVPIGGDRRLYVSDIVQGEFVVVVFGPTDGSHRRRVELDTPELTGGGNALSPALGEGGLFVAIFSGVVGLR